MKKKKFLNHSLDQDQKDIYNFEKGISSNRVEEHGEYSDHIYVSESPNKEQLYDRNNPIVKVLLLVLGLVAIIGTIYYILIFIDMI